MASTINSKCTNCGICVDVCPTKSITKGEKRHVIDSDTCIDCKACIEVCPYEAIVSVSEKKVKK